MSATFAGSGRGRAAGGRVAAFEVEAAQLHPGPLASATAAAARRTFIGVGPLFPVPAHPISSGRPGLIGCVIAGLLAGALSAALAYAVYASEDAFQAAADPLDVVAVDRRPVHRHRGYFFPQALGCRLRDDRRVAPGRVTRRVIVGVLLVKSTIWALSLGSGTSGGVLGRC